MTDQTTTDSPKTAEAADHGMERKYLIAFVVMCVCTIVSIAMAVTNVIPVSGQALVIFFVIAIALIKTWLVLAYFMHLKFEGPWKYMLLCPVVFVASGLPVCLYADIGLHYYGWRNPAAVTIAADVAPGELP